jgi:hypothetical protein
VRHDPTGGRRFLLGFIGSVSGLAVVIFILLMIELLTLK